MRVAVISPSDVNGKGGIERVVKYLVDEIGTSFSGDIQCRVVATRTTSLPVLKHISTIFVALHFFFLCATRQFDVLHVNVAPRGSTWRKAIFAGIGNRFGIPVLLHLHGSGYDQFFTKLPPARQAKIRRFFQGAARIVVLGEYWKNFVSTELGVPRDRISIIANGVPSRTEPRIAAVGTDVRFATLGILGERKGTDVLLAALGQLPAGLGWKATIAGNGEVEKYKAMAQSLSLSDRIDFPGWVDEQGAGRLLSAADIFILPSRAENQPIAILEAMARGLPVISTAIGAIPDQVTQDVNGFLVAPGDVGGLKTAIETITADADLRLEMGRQSRAIFERKFSIESCAAAFVGEYRALVSAKKR